MTNLERLISAEGVQGGVIADYDRRFLSYLSGKSFAEMDHASGELAAHARRLIEVGEFDKARIVSKATIAHLQFSRPTV